MQYVVLHVIYPNKSNYEVPILLSGVCTMSLLDEQTTDFNKVRDLPPAYFRCLFQLTDAYFKDEPWTVLGKYHVIKVEALGSWCVFRIPGGEKDCGVVMNNPYDHSLAGLCSNGNLMYSQPFIFKMFPEDEMLPENMRIVRKNKLAGTLAGDGSLLYPTMSKQLMQSVMPSKTEFLLLEKVSSDC